MVGGIVAQAPIAILTEYVQWRNATLIYSAFGGIIWIANLFVYRIIKAQRNHSESSVKMVFKLFYKAITKSGKLDSCFVCGIVRCSS